MNRLTRAAAAGTTAIGAAGDSSPVPPPKTLYRGWGVIRPGDRRAHYYVGTESLCRRVIFYAGELDPDNGKPSKDDCAACRRKLDAKGAT